MGKKRSRLFVLCFNSRSQTWSWGIDGEQGAWNVEGKVTLQEVQGKVYDNV